MPRKILHVDMDAFFASVEQRDDPALRGRPVVVGGTSGRGVVAAASYEARRFGIHSAMPMAHARRRCPELVVVRGRFEAYREASEQVREVFFRYTDLVEPMSLDEAYLDVTEPLAGPASGTLIAQAIRAEVREATGLPASAGVSFGKFLAKTASGMAKPDGIRVITPEQAPGVLAARSASRPAPTSRRAPRRTSGRRSARRARGWRAWPGATTRAPSAPRASASRSAWSGPSGVTSEAGPRSPRSWGRSPRNWPGASPGTASRARP